MVQWYYQMIQVFMSYDELHHMFLCKLSIISKDNKLNPIDRPIINFSTHMSSLCNKQLC